MAPGSDAAKEYADELPERPACIHITTQGEMIMIYATVDKNADFVDDGKRKQPYQVFELKNKIENSKFTIKALVYSCKTP